MGRLDGKVALVTGVARGQGEAEARRFAAEGAAVVVTDVLDEQGAAVAASLGTRVVYVRLDVTDEDGWKQAIAAAEARFGPVSVLVNNAGIAVGAPLAATSLDDYMAVVDVNQVGVFLGMREVIPSMTRAGGGSIVNVSSVDGMTGMAFVVAYVVSKFAVRGMTKVAAVELGALDIRVRTRSIRAVSTRRCCVPTARSAISAGSSRASRSAVSAHPTTSPRSRCFSRQTRAHTAPVRSS